MQQRASERFHGEKDGTGLTAIQGHDSQAGFGGGANVSPKIAGFFLPTLASPNPRHPQLVGSHYLVQIVSHL